MLQNIRDNSQSLIVKVIIGLIIGVFALFGAESIVGGFFNSPDTVATINGEEISEQELSTNVQNLRSNMGDSVDNMDEDVIREVALNQLLDNRLLVQTARDNGLVISDQSVDQRILQDPQFQVDGQFDRDMAMRTMTSRGYTPQSYRQELSQSMLGSQMANAYANSAFVTDAELEHIAALQGQTRDFRYLSVPPGSRTQGESIPEEELRTYYENNEQQFVREEQVALNYVVLDRSEIFDELEVDPEQVREQYEQQRAEADAGVERRAAHILLETGGERSEEEAMELASELRQRLDSDASFAELASEYSDDTASAQNGGDIGYSSGSAFPPEIEEVLTDMEEGEISEPVVTDFGVHLVRLTELDRQEYPPFEEQADEIERELKSAEVEDLYFERLETLGNLAFETFDLQRISEELDLELQQSEFFGRNGGNGPITGNEQVVEAAFSDEVLEESLNSEVIELDEERSVVVRVREHRPEELRPFEEVRSEIGVALQRQREQERAREIGERLLASLRDGEPVESIIEEQELQWQAHEEVGRQQPSVNPEVRQRAFSMQPPEETGQPRYQGVTLSNGAYVVIELQDVEQGSLEDMDEEQRRSLVQNLIQQRGRRAFDGLLANQREAADITRNL